MNKLKYVFYKMLGFKVLLRKYFKFIESDYSFVETEDKNLTIPEWLKRGIAYTNNKKVIVLVDNIRENRFVTIIYVIQSDLKIPIHNEELYYTLESFLNKKNIGFDANQITNYSTANGVKESIEKTAYYIKKYEHELLT